MARGKKCSDCSTVMYADIEDHQMTGTWVTYVCRNGACPAVKGSGYPTKVKEFESK
jgi:hypothetical protein